MGMLTAYVLARKFVFLQSRTSVRRSFAGFGSGESVCGGANVVGERGSVQLAAALARDRGVS